MERVGGRYKEKEKTWRGIKTRDCCDGEDRSLWCQFSKSH